MDKATPNLLTIQKFVYLLDDYHYKEFITHLKSVNATMPAKLADTIRKKLPAFHSHEELCKKIYGSAGKAQRSSFNQLSSHTFRLSSNLATNYPAYLQHNIPNIQRLVNVGQKAEADMLADSIYEIATKVEDFTSLLSVLTYYSEEAFALRKFQRVIKLDVEISSVTETIHLFHELRQAMNVAFIDGEQVMPANKLEELRRYFEAYHTHKSHAVRILSLFAFIVITYQYNPRIFDGPTDFKKIELFEKEIENYGYVVMPFLADYKGDLLFYKLNSPPFSRRDKEWWKSYLELSAHYDSVKFRGVDGFSGFNQLLAIAVSSFLKTYSGFLHLPNYTRLVKPVDRKMMNELLKDGEQRRKRYATAKDELNFNELVLRILSSSLMVLSGGNDTKRGVDDLEALLITYQQINLSTLTDGIYLFLMLGYFAQADYDKCEQTFKRYLKVIKDKTIYVGNNMQMHFYYYLSKWLITGSKQYPEKLNSILEKLAKDKRLPAGIIEIIRHFNVPCQLPAGSN
ncbi:MAG TPA: hypothetical protein VG603_14895 [Chitinophagales bacterium]|nr:hypothetical protein [Chitinophagales bacterium]